MKHLNEQALRGIQELDAGEHLPIRDLKELSVDPVPEFPRIPLSKLKSYVDDCVDYLENQIETRKANKTVAGLGYIIRTLAKMKGIILPPTASSKKMKPINAGGVKVNTHCVVGTVPGAAPSNMGSSPGGTSIAINAAATIQDTEAFVVVIFIAPSRYVTDMHEVPPSESKLLRRALPSVVRHELAHRQDFQGKSTLSKVGVGVTRGFRMLGHLAREIIRNRGILPSAAQVGYFRMKEEYIANVTALVELWKSAPAKMRKSMTLLDLLYAYGEGFNNGAIRDALIQAYYDDPTYRKAILRDLKAQGVKLKKGKKEDVGMKERIENL